MIKINFNGQVIDWPANQPLPTGATLVTEQPTPTPVPVPATGDFLGFISQRESEQWYKPTQQYTVTAENIKAGLKASVREHTSVYGTSMFLDIEMSGQPKQSVKVSGTIASAIREAGKVDSAVVEQSSIMLTQLGLTEHAIKENEKLPADKRVKGTMYRASFSWS